MAAGAHSILWSRSQSANGPACRSYPLNQDWLFGGRLSESALQPAFDDAAFSRVSLPHCVACLSWHKWDPAAWEDTWVYRRHFTVPGQLRDYRVFLHFDGVMLGATPGVNGHAFPKHLGGSLPSRYEIGGQLREGENVIAVAVDSRWSNVPPEGSPKGPASIDYLEPGGIAAAPGKAGIYEPLPGVPCMVAEAVGQFEYDGGKGFKRTYRRRGDPVVEREQAVLHAQAHNAGAADPRCAGVVAWCAFDYGSLLNSYEGVKYPGVADVFRVPKLGAAFYLAQIAPGVRPVIEPAFYWDFGPRSPSGPGASSAIFSNCDSLKLFVDGKLIATLRPDRANYPHIKYPPFFADLVADGSAKPELRIDGYVDGRLALSRSFSADHTRDQLFLRADDRQLAADGSDATRLVFGITDRYGAPRQLAQGQVNLKVTGPWDIVGDNPFSLAKAAG